MLSSPLRHWRTAQTATSNMAQASRAKMDHGPTAPKVRGPSRRTEHAPASSVLLVSRGCETLATGAGSGCVAAKAELTVYPCPSNWISHRHYSQSLLLNHRKQLQGKVRSRPATICLVSA